MPLAVGSRYSSPVPVDPACRMACLADGMKGFALQMPCLAGQTFVPAFKTKGFFVIPDFFLKKIKYFH
jgi:hypothetical protein